MNRFVGRTARPLALAAFLLSPAAAAAALEAGDRAPDFTLEASDGETYSLSQFRGVRPVVVAFFPKAFTGG